MDHSSSSTSSKRVVTMCGTRYNSIMISSEYATFDILTFSHAYVRSRRVHVSTNPLDLCDIVELNYNTSSFSFRKISICR